MQNAECPTGTRTTSVANAELAFPSGGRGTTLVVDEVFPNANKKIMKNADFP